MIQKDYILRLIEEAAKVLAKALKLKNDGDYEQAKQILDEAYNDILKIDKNAALFVSNNEFIAYLTNGLQLEPGKIEILANFFTEDASIEENILTKKNLIEKALLLYKYIGESDKTFSFERINKTTRLQKMLEDLS